ncbi:DNA/RNA non-specific endonuclease [Caulobacter sp. Root487D2Y]|uniref:DNA/RNA non-specific endonuclease n=1 Tax=Caulobacter sp. Root487D2Y TaxID=1736547 RepID=UPI0009E7406A|nr:DNA/RNA non-specific endonuclease [Caulobacter sp. Root487D2Y]
MMKLICMLAITLALGGAASAADFPCGGATTSPFPALAPNDHDHGRYAPQAAGLRKTFTAYQSVFDDADDDDGDGRADLRFNPEYVAYELRGVGPNAAGDYPEPAISIQRPSRWYNSVEFAPLLAAVPGVTAKGLDESYAGLGSVWNRGHLAMSDHAQRISAEAACNTHQFWNASPQAQDLNQGPWRFLETYSAAAANKYRSVWIVTGPIFDPATPKLTIGDAGEAPVEIPDGFFKILLHEGPSGVETLAFIYEQPNALDAAGRPTPSAQWVNCNKAKSLHHRYDPKPQLVSIAQIELRTGLRFFVGRPDREHLTARAADHLWPVETRYWDAPSACAGQRGVP